MTDECCEQYRNKSDAEGGCELYIPKMVSRCTNYEAKALWEKTVAVLLLIVR